MIQLPGEPDDTARALGSVMREEFTNLTVATITLAHQPAVTVDQVALVNVWKNGQQLTLTARTITSSTTATVWHRDNRTGSTSTTWILSGTPDSTASLLVWFNGGLLIGGGTDYSLSGATITFGSAPAAGDKNAAYYPVTSTSSSSSSAGTSYTISGNVITLDQALVATDVVTVQYHYRNI